MVGSLMNPRFMNTPRIRAAATGWRIIRNLAFGYQEPLVMTGALRLNTYF
jgi:hypothetical protein